MIVIRANDTGFFYQSQLDVSISPIGSLGIGVSVDAEFVLGTDGEWVTQEIFWAEGVEVRATLPTGDLYDLDVVTEGTVEIEVVSVSLFRMQEGRQIEIGSIEFPDGISVVAQYDTLGTDPSHAWQVDFGDSLARAISEQGVKFYGGDADDIFTPNQLDIPISGKVVIIGGAGNDQLTGTWGDDKILGGSGNDTLYDERGHNVLKGGGGDDVLGLGYASNLSVARGGWGNDKLVSNLGSDRLFGNQGNDELAGGSGDDFLSGGRGTDLLNGGDGEDTLIGGLGKDVMSGGDSVDTFVFKGASGQDRITDFDAGEDLIHLHGENGMNELTFQQLGEDLLIDHSHGSIVLEGFNQADITEDMFIF